MWSTPSKNNTLPRTIRVKWTKTGKSTNLGLVDWRGAGGLGFFWFFFTSLTRGVGEEGKNKLLAHPFENYTNPSREPNHETHFDFNK